MEIDDEDEFNINMRSVSVVKSKPFNSSDIDVIMHNTHGIRSDEE